MTVDFLLFVILTFQKNMLAYLLVLCVGLASAQENVEVEVSVHNEAPEDVLVGQEVLTRLGDVNNDGRLTIEEAENALIASGRL